MQKITLFDTSITSTNAGDIIIMEAVKKELKALFPSEQFFSLQTHGIIGKKTYSINKQSDYAFVGGTNLLNPRMNVIRGSAWRLRIADAFNLSNLILMGVGAEYYQYPQDYPASLTPEKEHTNQILHPIKDLIKRTYTDFFLNKILNKTILHAARDSYTEIMLRQFGFDNVINTGCPTTWDLTVQHCAEIPTQKAQHVVFSLSDYQKDLKASQQLIDILKKNYTKVYFWGQGGDSYAYFKCLDNIADITVIGGNLWSYDALLQDKNIDLDCINFRLHGGIRALQNKRRTIILGIDHRAIEITKDIGLPMLLKSEMGQLEALLNDDIVTNLALKQDNINTWRKQFR